MNNPQAAAQTRIRETIGDLTIQNIMLEAELRAAHAEIQRLKAAQPAPEGLASDA